MTTVTTDTLTMSGADQLADTVSPPATEVTRPDQIELMGLPIDRFTLDTVVEYLIVQSRAGRGGYLMTPNVDNLRNLTRRDELFARAMSADIRVADGMPLIWASRIQRTPLPARVPGSDLITELAGSIARSGQSVFLLGGTRGTAQRAADVLRARFPTLNVVGTHCPPMGFEHDHGELTRVHGLLSGAAPDFVYLGLPFEKASALAAGVRRQLPATWFLGLGISFSFICGDVHRAPDWVQAAGLEWLHRLAQEPRRLGRRYLREGLPFVARLLVTAAAQRGIARPRQIVSPR